MKAVDWIDGTVRFIDQTLLPAEERFVITNDIQVIAEAIRSLRIRGAPAIGVAAAFGLVLGLRSPDSPDGSSLALRFDRAARLLGSTRPTAVNLFNVLNRMRGVLQAVSGVGDREAIQQLEREARVIQAEDIEACHRIGDFGAYALQCGCSGNRR
jgi:methylthioribose-1-phosphate isomerase